MTEYDFSPEAFEAHIHKQQGIARWAYKTSQVPQKSPYTPPTPAVQTTALQRAGDYSDDEYDFVDDDRSRRQHRRRESKDHHRDRHRDSDRDRDRGIDRESRHHHSQSESIRPTPKRHRSASQSATSHRPDPSRQFSAPPPLPIPPHKQSSPTAAYPQPYVYPVPYPTKLTSPRDSRHSSRSSSTQVASPSSYYPTQAQVPYSAPPHKQMTMPPPVRSQTSPTYSYQQDSKYTYPTPSPYFPQGYPTSPVKGIDLANAPQLPHSAYAVKQPPLLKRLFTNLLHLNKAPQPQPRRRRQRNNSF